MPASARDNVAVDHFVTRATLAGTLQRLVDQPAGTAVEVPDALRCEDALSRGEGDTMELLDTIGTPSKIACPDCSGVLWEIRGSRPPRYRCHTGHAYTQHSLVHTHALRTDEALWRALRALEEREALLRAMASASRQRHDEAQARRLEAEADHALAHAEQLQRLVTAA